MPPWPAGRRARTGHRRRRCAPESSGRRRPSSECRAAELMDPDPPTVVLGDSAAEAADRPARPEADYLLVTDRVGELRGVVGARDFVVSRHHRGRLPARAAAPGAGPSTSLRAPRRGSRRCSPTCSPQGWPRVEVIAVYSAIIDTIVRRAIELVFADHPDLHADAFTWLSLGSNGRREAVPSSDVDSAVAFDDAVTGGGDRPPTAPAFAEVHDAARPGPASSRRPTARRRRPAGLRADERRVARRRPALAGGTRASTRAR